ncbi:MAG: hypothetical protein NTZ05_08000 [Chloroflexi bacterium]|nr:hypothetical protein [Chloroflexota bacterium]
MMPQGMGMGMPGMGGMGGGMGMPGGMPGMGGMGMPQQDPYAEQQEMMSRIATGLVGARVRMRALLELLEGKGVLAPGEFDAHAGVVWERDYNDLADELLTPAAEEPGEELADPSRLAAMPPPPPQDHKSYAEAVLHNFVSESVGSRVRLRAVLELLELKGVFAAGEFEAKADEIWDRDYEELTMDFYKMNF